jgi:hypothetical protein
MLNGAAGGGASCLSVAHYEAEGNGGKNIGLGASDLDGSNGEWASCLSFTQ